VRPTPAWLTMPDGVRLAADLYRPEGDGPFAVLLEALPYRKDDLTAGYRPEYRRLAAEGGFVVCRVDLRGTGSSGGDATDEYPEIEQQDLAEVIAWLAAQPWSNGRVGMFGTSYSGFNSIQMACEQPPALHAICAIYATDDRYTDDVHYMGGALRAIDLVDYCHYMTPMSALPPVPAVYGDGWRDEWARRVEHMEPWLLTWLREQRDGPYWRHGSLRPDYARIHCATLLVGGWADGYRNNSFRTFAALRAPKALLMGPWSHMSTETSLPGPHIDLVPEMIRWFGHWLRDEDNGVETDAPVRVFVRHVLPATLGYLLVQATLLLPAFILAEATLSYVGLGFPEELPTWGTMLADAADLNVITRFPWLLTPAVAIFAVVFAANLLLQGTRREYVQ